MICYLDSCRDKVLKVCSPEKFGELTQSQRTAMLINAYRSGENPEAKSQLPAFVFMGYDPDLLEGKPGRRQKAVLKPTGLVMLDFDHISKAEVKSEKRKVNNGSEDSSLLTINSSLSEAALTPYEVYDRFLKNMPKLGLTLEHDLAFAHVTPSGDGLRLVVLIRKGKSVVQMQEAIGKLVGIECDKAVKDLSRLSFCPAVQDILYINKQLLFSTTLNNDNYGTDNLNTQQPDSTTSGTEPAATSEVRQPQPQLQADAGGTNPAGTQLDGQGNGRGHGERRDGLVSADRPLNYHGVPYKTIVEKWIELRGGTPEPGDRHATLVELAMDLRKICDNDKDWIASLMPDFDKGEEEKLDCIEWAVGRQHSKVSGTLLDALTALGIEVNGEKRKVNSGSAEDSSLLTINSSLSEQSEALPPAMPERLPRLVELLTSKVLEHQKPAVAAMVFPALAVHVNNCLFKLRDNTDVELSLMCCLLATQSAGKGCVKAPLRLIMSDIKAEDKINRQRERDWQESQKNKKANEKGASRPTDIVIRILSADTTPAAFLGRLMAAETGDGQNPNLCTYSQVDEIEDLYRFCASGGRNMVQQMIKRTWDRDDIGAERWSANSANISTVLRWNWAASSTIEGGKKFFKNCLTDGTTSRVDFCTIIPPSKVIDFCYGDYDDEFEDELKPYIDNLKSFRCDRTAGGRVIPKMFPKVRDLEERMNAYINETASAMPDETWANYAWRAKVMAIKKLIVLYIANGCEWEDAFEEFTWWTFNYNMWCKMNLFYDAASAAFQDERITCSKGHKSPLKYMKRTFTYAEFANMCQMEGYKQKPEAILRKYKSRGVIAYREDKTYVINPDYARKFGIE